MLFLGYIFGRSFVIVGFILKVIFGLNMTKNDAQKSAQKGTLDGGAPGPYTMPVWG